MYKAGDVSLVLDPKLEQEAEAKRNRYLEEDPRVGIIESYLEKRYNEFIATFTNPAPDDLRVCSKEIAVKALDIQQAPRYIYSEIKKIVGDLPNWEYVDKRRDCGEYGRQNYFRPKEVYNNPF